MTNKKLLYTQGAMEFLCGYLQNCSERGEITDTQIEWAKDAVLQYPYFYVEQDNAAVVTAEGLADKLFNYFDGDSSFNEQTIREVILDALDYMKS